MRSFLGDQENGRIMLVVGGLILFKVLLYNTYSSTDLEVHRNWMAITHNLALVKWYVDATSEWTLDYPPFFAFLEKGMAEVASRIGMQDILLLQKESLFNQRVLYAMRSSVLLLDTIYLCICAIVPTFLPSRHAFMPVFLLLATHSSLILLDNIHFQYNSFLTAFVLLSIFLMCRRQYLLGALVFALLLNLKHIYMYYAPGYVAIYLLYYFQLYDITVCVIARNIMKGFILLLFIVVPFIISFGPFVYMDGLDGLSSIISRLFPIQRGLTHSFWAPNAWSLYNTVDLIANKLCGVSGLELDVPVYTQGLVQEYSHTFLPTIGVRGSLLCIIVSLSPVFILPFIKRGDKRVRDEYSISTHPCILLFLSASSFFLFGYHVHEKAIILLLFPMIILTARFAVFSPLLLDLTLVSSSSLSPLLFTTSELPLRQAFYIFQITSTILFVVKMHKLPYGQFISTTRHFTIVYLFILDVYSSYIHTWLFPTSMPFLPLLLISVSNALILLWIYLRTLLIVYPFIQIYLAKRDCIRTEMHYTNGSESIKYIMSEDEVKIVASADMASLAHDPSLAAVAIVFFDYQTGNILYTARDIVIRDIDYIPHFLALSESSYVARLLLNTIHSKPELTPQIVLCDGNGRFHPRKFGLACHISALTGIATAGISKNVDWGVIGGEKRVDMEERGRKIISSLPRSLGFTPFDLFLPVTANIVTLPNTAFRQFVSAGLGVDLNLATHILLHMHSCGVHPIAEADSVARVLCRQFLQ